MPKTIKYRLIFFLTLTTVIVGIISFGFTHYREIKVAEELGLSASRELANLFREQINNLANKAYADIWWSYDLAEGLLKGLPSNEYYREIENKIIKSLAARKGFIEVIDDQGNVIYSQGLKLAPAYFKYLVYKPAMMGSVSGFYEIADLLGKKHITYLRAEQVLNEEGKPLGVIVVGYSLEENQVLFTELFTQELQKQKLLPGVILYWKNKPLWHFGDVRFEPLLGEQIKKLQKENMLTEIRIIDGKRFYVSYLPLENRNSSLLTLGVFLPADLLVRPYRISFWQGLLIYIVLLGLLVVLGIYVIIGRQLEKPLNELMEVLIGWIEGKDLNFTEYQEKYPEYKKLFKRIYDLKTTKEKIANQWYRLAEGVYNLGEAANDGDLVKELVFHIKSLVEVKGIKILLKNLKSDEYFPLYTEGQVATGHPAFCPDNGEYQDGTYCYPITLGSEKLGFIIIAADKDKLTEEAREFLNNLILMSGPLVKLYLLKNYLAEISLRDPLTQAFNRRFLEDAILENRDCNYSLIFIDLDKFKEINDTYGHNAGDLVLIKLTQKIRENLRSQDQVIRMGGDEILIYLPNTPIELTREIANRIMELIRKEQFTVMKDTKTVTFNVSASMGIGSCREGESFEEVLARVDKALYRAKELGRNQIVVAAD
ncbi:sensor domain-containing diguanylate cyclase [Carboxydothermus hydrogenoformans]|uniref:GGDEF domain protein n=1 Tax=Carboxydothermus hydrogenoformans (strain ATCC BAA-161 / DSM 6008 / Z-2901) TaxID=246194 RepID=Q3AE75_CARHZ|nr:diguanylate cyclase [Carboxydothermus hydrogenoformans]ABB14321.1 GGDEF domain protein [Carboxydothermus hydrogenoformans Z-2901]